MYCHECGAEVPNGKNYCNKCGAKLVATADDPESSTSLDNTDGSTASPTKQGAEPRPSRKPSPAKAVAIIALCLCAGIALGFGVVKAWELFGDSSTAPTYGPEDELDFGEPVTVENMDPEDPASYYLSNSHVYKQIKASTSSDALSESAITESIQNRGFEEYQITTTYSMDGEFFLEKEVTGDSDEAHPSYDIIYITPDEHIWVIYNNNGDFMANPLFYNAESTKPELLISEHDYLTSYDSESDSFYHLIPGEELSRISTVKRIDAETLNPLTKEKLEQL